MEINVIMEALKFMVLGMGVVFTFLVILIFVLKGQANLIAKFFPAKEIKSTRKVQPTVDTSNSSKIAAIVAAVQHHKNLKG